MPIMSLALLLAGAAQPDIRIDAVPGRGFSAYVETLDAKDLTALTDRVKVAAAQKCGKLSVRFGRFSFDNRIDLTRNVAMIDKYRQSFFCFDPATDPYKPVAADWKASPADEASATGFVTRFLRSVDSGDAAGMAMMDPLIEISAAEWKGVHDDTIRFRSGAGQLTPELRGWANNPEGTAYPGAYAYFSVLSDHPGIAGTCGGLLVHRTGPNQYRIAQYDVRYVAQALVDQQGLSGDALNALCG